MPDEKLIRRRLPAREKSIASVNPDTDVRLRLTGTVIGVGPNSVVLDDGTGKTEVFFEKEPSVSEGQIVRVVTRIFPLIEGFECRGEALQELDGFDIDLYKKARKIANR